MWKPISRRFSGNGGSTNRRIASKYILDGRVMSADALFQIGQFSGQILVGGQLFTHENERANDPDAGFNGNWAVENAGEHERAVFGENYRKIPVTTMQT